MAILSDFNEDDKNNQITTKPSSHESQLQLQKPKNNNIQSQTKDDQKKQEGKEEDEKPKQPLLPNKLNGLDTENYSWGQSLEEINITIPVPPGTQATSITVVIETHKIKVGLKDQVPIIDGERELFQGVKVEDCLWSLEDKKTVSVLLTKIDRMNWWKSLLKGDPEINMQKVEPAPSRLSELDLETRSMVEKMMFDQRQKKKGLPTSDEIAGQDMMKKIMSQHPGIDLSGAKNFTRKA
ncbi:hypothetical protein BUALT_Bualt14G0032800 [Buddleja alternifolia]|uniref:CS domain-containing protein n=1 Tax=Buddleja alternifolia TaxID=168488 RepID=A0AAV6WMR3_9LAMI|nr:hypothetical protein BUALT_Bualt14G0032800 [Buddleja alternifolia]